MPVTNRVAAWFDLSRQNAARGANQLSPLNNLAEFVDYVFDGSGHGHHLTQPGLTHRPRFIQDFNGSFLAFDGQDDFLTSLPIHQSLPGLTAFVVARPRTNSGTFRALFTLHQFGRNDYTSGINVDLGSTATPVLSRLNVEGPGFSGEGNLIATAMPFRQWRIFSLSVSEETNGVSLAVDGVRQGGRARTGATPVQGR